MSDDEIAMNVGDVVCLKSGGTWMTVTDAKDDRLDCSWFDRAGYHLMRFPRDCLIHAAVMHARESGTVVEVFYLLQRIVDGRKVTDPADAGSTIVESLPADEIEALAAEALAKVETLLPF